MWKYILVSVIALSPLMAGDRSDLQGTWLLDAGHSQVSGEAPKSEVLVIDQKADSVVLTRSTGAEKKFEISCNTLGKECKLKEDGHPVQVSLWYNGPALVLMEVHGNSDTGSAVKSRFVPSEDGKTLKLEVSHISPPGPADTYVFMKQDTTQSSASTAPAR